MTILAVAGVSARAMAEAAVRDGFEAIALDLFGDVDTCRTASRWLPLGEPGALQIDVDCTLSALRLLAQRGDVAGWVPGSGFEGLHEVIAEGGAWLPLIGNRPETVRRVRDPRAFFRVLDALGVPHPPVARTAPADLAGWLLKDMRGCGGWQVAPAPPAPAGTPAPPHHVYQRRAAGQPMSATFVADGCRARVLGFNEQIVQPVGDRPWVFAGLVGPVAVAAQVVHEVSAAASVLAGAFGLRGLGSLDFMLQPQGRWQALEVNPRPPASLSCYLHAAPMAAHVRACLEGVLPPDLPAGPPTRSEGHRIVFASRALRLADAPAAALAARTDTHDLPSAGARFHAGDPVCSVSAAGADAAEVHALLQAAHADVSNLLETA